jgi:hypothetical protein
MPLLINKVAAHTTIFQVDNACESSIDVTRRGEIVDFFINSTASKVKPTSNISRIIIDSV